MAIYFPDPNLPVQSKDWTDKVEVEIKKLDKRKGGAGGSGSDGVAGPQGPAGADGAQGPQGPQGETGPQGIQGEQGFDGDTGPQGEQGLQGIQGIQGETGLTGSQGPQGEQGLQGIQGVKGDTGDQGIQGIQGIKGDTGLTGAQGIQGETGLTGEQGIQGIQGIQGVQGVKGDTGAQGPQGLTGLSAYQVAQLNGFTGTEAEWLATLEGDVGPQGPIGETGPAGPGLATGGTEGQIIVKVDDTDYNTMWVDNYAPDTRIIVKNDSGVAIARGDALMAVGATGDRIRVAKAVADGSVEPRYMLGVAYDSIENGFEGYLTITGDVTRLNTSAYTIGTLLYIDPAVPGGLTAVEPVSPNLVMAIAIVTRSHATTGRMFIRMWSQQSGLHELHDVLITTPADGALLKYDAASELWVNSNVISGGTA